MNRRVTTGEHAAGLGHRRPTDAQFAPAMLGQVELGQSTPTINVLWKIARALAVPFSTLITDAGAPSTTVMPRAAAKVLLSADGSFSSRALFPFNTSRAAEFYELRVKPRGVERAEPHPPGTTENLVVASGAIQLRVEKEEYLLRVGDAIVFDADVAHAYSNPGDVEASMFLVMTYADRAQ